MKDKRKALYLVLISILSGFVLLGLVVDSFYKSLYLLNSPLHSTMEAFGAVTAIFTAIILLQKELKQDTVKYRLIATGLLTMGILDCFHAVSSIGHGFVLLHNTSNLLGSFWFAMVWLPAVDSFTAKNKLTPWLVAGSSVVLGVLMIQFRELFPQMLQNGQFTHTAIAINSLGGVLFMAAGIFFLLDFHRFIRPESYLFAGILFLFSISNFEFFSADIWNSNWWVMHLQRLISYLLVAGFVIHKYQKTVSELAATLQWQKLAEDALQKSFQELETRVEERTLELSGVNRKLLMEISDRKLAEGHTKKSEEKYKNIVELTSDLIYMSDIDGNQIFMNKAGYQLLETTPEEVIGKPWSKWIHPADRDGSLKTFTLMLQRGIDLFDYENRYTSKSGRVINVLHNIRILRNENGEITGTQGIARDITRRKQIETALGESEEKYRLLFENESDAIIVCEAGTSRILEVNTTFVSLYGYSKEEAKNMTAVDLSSEPDMTIASIKKTAAEGSVHVSVRWHKKKNGASFPVEISASTFIYKEQKMICAIFRDITERKRTEEELNRYREDLEDLVGERTHELINTSSLRYRSGYA